MLCAQFEAVKVSGLSIYHTVKCILYNLRLLSGSSHGPKLSMISNKHTGPGRLNIEVLTEANVGETDEFFYEEKYSFV